MTEVDGGWSFYYRWRSTQLVGGGKAARPTVRIPYTEREPATGRAVSARLAARTTHQSRICPGPSPVRRACASDQSGGFTRLSSSTTHQSRVCPRPLAATKGPPGGRVVLLSDPSEGSRGRLEEAISSGRSAPDTGIIANSRSFDNLWKVKK